MGLFRSMVARAADPVESGWAGSISEWGASAAGVQVDATTALYHTTVMACVAILAQDMAKLPIGMYRRLPNGGKVEVKDHFLAQLLRKPNGWQTRFEFVEMMQAALVLRGNAYAAIVRDSRGVPNQLVPIHPDRVSLYEAPSGDYFFFVTRQGLHEMAVLRDLPIIIASEDMFHLRWMSTWNSLLGSSRVAMMKESIGLGIAQEQQAARLAGNGARPGGVLQTDRQLTPDVVARIKADWQALHGGWRNAGKTAILEEGLKWQQLGMTMVDAEFMKARDFSIEDIARGFRIPHFKLGLPIERGDLIALQQMYLNDVILTECERWLPKLAELGRLGLDPNDNRFVEFDYSHFLKADIQTRLTAMRTGVVGMIYTPNEAREGEGLPAVEGGDVLYQPVNVAPIGFTPASAGGAGPGSDMTGEAAPGGAGDKTAVQDDTAPSV